MLYSILYYFDLSKQLFTFRPAYKEQNSGLLGKKMLSYIFSFSELFWCPKQDLKSRH